MGPVSHAAAGKITRNRPARQPAGVPPHAHAADASSPSITAAGLAGDVLDLETVTSADPETVWRSLVSSIAARSSMRLYVAETGKYDLSSKLTTRRLPEVPAAVPVFSSAARGRRAELLALDFDPQRPTGSATADDAVKRDVRQLLTWLQKCGATYIVDRSPRGGMHVLVPLAHGERFRRDNLLVLLDLLKQRLSTFDPMPMLNTEQGCITPPGTRCKGGGFRQLVGLSLDQARTALATRSQPGLVARLVAILDPERWLSTKSTPQGTDAPDAATAADKSPAADEALPAGTALHSPVRPWVPLFLSTGHPPDLIDPAGRAFTPSHARLSVLEQHAARGWTLTRIQATRHDPTWAGFWAGYTHRRDHAKRLRLDWERAYTRARRRVSSANEHKSSPLAHKPKQLHTGGVRGIRWKLAAARRWILDSGYFSGTQQWTALAVVTALAYGISQSKTTSVAHGGRWLSIAAGLVGEDTVRAVLHRFRALENHGSPVQFVAPWNARDRCGDRYRLVTPQLEGRDVTASEWEAYAARPEPVDPVWSRIGLGAWWCYEVLQAIEPGAGESVSPEQLAAAARVSLSTIHRAVRRLAEHALVDHGYGWVARTGRTPRRIPELTADADERRRRRIARHRVERAAFWAFVDIIHANYSATEISGYATLAELHADTEDYLHAVLPPTRAREHRQPPPPPDAELPSDADAVQLLQDLLGATLLETG